MSLFKNILLTIAIGTFLFGASQVGAVAAETLPPKPVPYISELRPNPVQVGGPDFVLDVYGTGFMPGITGLVDKIPRVTKYDDQNHFSMEMLAVDIAAVGQKMIQGQNADGGLPGRMVPLVVVKASPYIGTVIKNAATNEDTNAITAGGRTYDTSTLYGATPKASGTMTYTLYSDENCTVGKIAGVKAVKAGVVPKSDHLTSPAAGTFYWGAYYSGDWNNNSAISDCRREVLTVVPAVHTLNVNSVGAGGVVITSTTGHGGDTNYPKPNLPDGTFTSLVAPPVAGGFAFLNWGGCDNVSLDGFTCSTTINGNRTVTANYGVVATGIKVTKKTIGGIGTFWFTSDNDWFDPASLTTDVPNLAVERTIALVPGSYSIFEDPQLGWIQNYVDCTNWDGTTNVVNVVAGEITTCVFENTLQGGLKIVKNATAGAPNAVFGYAGASTFFPATVNTFGANGSVGPASLPPGTIPFITESMPGGWTFGSAACIFENGRPNGSILPNGRSNVVIESGKLTTCTFNNTYAVGTPTTLKLVKVVDNRGGGTKVAGDWTLTATGFLNSFQDNGNPAVGTFHNVIPGTGYALSEYTLVNYTLSDVICDRGSLHGNIITLNPGEIVTCRIYNTWNPLPTTLKLTKTVVNTGDGTKTVADWDLTATSSSGSFTHKGDASAFYVVAPGVPYTLSESPNNISGYTAGNWVCTGGGTQSGATGNSITLTAGQKVTCNITNTYRPSETGRIKIDKNTPNSTLPATFDYTVTGPSALNPSITTSGGTGDSGSMTATAGTTYSVIETVPAGWEFVSAVCTLQGSITQTGSNATKGKSGVTVEVGKLTTCTFINKPQGALKIVKQAIGGNGVFGYSVSGPSTASLSINTSLSTEAVAWVDASTSNNLYSIVETLPTGWSFIPPVVCTLQSGSQTGNNVTNGKNLILVESGKVTTCTFKNTLSAKGSIEIIKKTDKEVDEDTIFNYQIELEP